MRFKQMLRMTGQPITLDIETIPMLIRYLVDMIHQNDCDTGGTS